MASDLSSQEIIHQVAEAINRLDWDAKEMGVKVDWTSLWFNIGDEYEEEMSFRSANSRRAYLQARVYGERTGE